MASFAIETKLRPCYVATYKYDEKKRGYVRKEELKGLFHTWSHNSSIVDPSYLKGGHSGGVVSAMYGIVELEDGTVHLVELKDIRFCDNEFGRFIFPDELEKTEVTDDE